jgi:hypothetical protein
MVEEWERVEGVVQSGTGAMIKSELGKVEKQLDGIGDRAAEAAKKTEMQADALADLARQAGVSVGELVEFSATVRDTSLAGANLNEQMATLGGVTVDAARKMVQSFNDAKAAEARRRQRGSWPSRRLP